MIKILTNLLLLICFGCFLLPEPGETLRIKRSDSLANVTNNSSNNTGLPLVSLTAFAGAAKPQVKTTDKTETDVATATNAAADAVAEKKLQLLDDFQPSEYLTGGRMQRCKRREEPKSAHHVHHHNADASNAAPPYVYFNKLVSPDGKQELKEFQLMAPGVVIESMQHDINYGNAAGDMGGVLVLNADSNPSAQIRGMSKPKHYHKHKSSLALPPFLYMLQQMLQPNLNVDMVDSSSVQRNRMDAPIYQFLDGAVDNALRNNHDIFDREREIELSDKDSDKGESLMGKKTSAELTKEEKLKESVEQLSSRKENELILSCPIHHEHHATSNGESIDDDVVLVNECHII
ncbi:uncharacterized protein LOC6559439 [Drosophila grimshawi]|uniref:GH22140 n=1 Tax=Drosophila grimshawi TaxID=7222 RepID=B4J4L5_DROGR|nr:uncharacterized protein LOC6559439 [Drosophila grimshawi]EDW02720.1 GH22140 [Drosophila grimshawi]